VFFLERKGQCDSKLHRHLVIQGLATLATREGEEVVRELESLAFETAEPGFIFLLITVVWHQGTNSLHVTFFLVILIAWSMDILGGRGAIIWERILHWIGIEKKEISHV